MQLSTRMHSCVHLMFPKPKSRGADVNIYADKRTEKFHWRLPPDQELSLMKMQATEGGIEGQLFATTICCFPHNLFLGVSTFRQQLRQKMTTNSGKLKLMGCLTAGFLRSLYSPDSLGVIIFGFWHQQLSGVAAVIPRTAIFTFPYLSSLKKSDLN